MADERAPKIKQTELTSQEWNGRTYIGVDLSWRGSPKIVAKQSRFFDKILEIAELPERDQWPKIIGLSQRYDIPSIRDLIGPSPLETNAAALLTALAFSNHRDWVRLVRTFFKIHNLVPGLRGRPGLQHPMAAKDKVRGIQIDKLIAKLEKGFQVKMRSKQSSRFDSGDEQTARKLSNLGYGDKEIEAIIKSTSLDGAGRRLYLAINKVKENVDLKGIRNSYARYKRLSEADPKHSRKPSNRI